MVEEYKKLIYGFGEFRIDVMKRRLTRAGQAVSLHSKAFDLLLVMVESGGRVLTKDELIETVWRGQILEEGNLPVNMSAIRKALGEKAAEPHYIITIPGCGYRFVADVKEIREGNGLVIESQTVSQITIEEETETFDDVIDISPRNNLLNGKEENPSNAAIVCEQPHTEENKIAVNSSLPVKTFFTHRLVISAFVICLVAITAISGFVLFRARFSNNKSNRFQNLSIKQLTSNGKVLNAALSPDGKFFVYVIANKSKQSLWLGQTEGSEQIELRPFEDITYRTISFAPDGKSIYYTAFENDASQITLYKLPILGGVVEKMRDDINGYFTISPEGKRIAFARLHYEKKTWSLVISNLNGTNEKEVVTLRASDYLIQHSITWSPDGSMMSFCKVKDGERKKHEIFLLQTESGEVKSFSKSPLLSIERVEWLKDGSGLLLLAEGDTKESRQLWFISYPDGETRRLTTDLATYSLGLSVSTDSNNFLVIQHQQINNIWIAPANDFTKAKQITFGAFNRNDGILGLDWTPDGKIVYVASVGKGQTIWIMDADGNNAKELTSVGYSDTMPSVSPDGSFMVFQSNRVGESEIWRVGLDGKNLKQLTTCGKNFQPALSPDGKWLYYKSTCDNLGAIWRMPVDGGEAVRVTDAPASWAWVSPDGKWIACEYRVSSTKTALAVISIEDKKQIKFFDTPRLANFRYGIHWTPDSKYITYRDWGEGLWQQPIEGGKAQQIKGLPQEKFYTYGWSRDGKLFALTRGDEIRDVVLIQNVNDDSAFQGIRNIITR